MQSDDPTIYGRAIRTDPDQLTTGLLEKIWQHPKERGGFALLIKRGSDQVDLYITGFEPVVFFKKVADEWRTIPKADYEDWYKNQLTVI